MRKLSRWLWTSVVLAMGCIGSAHSAEMGMGIRAGTLGGGLDFDISLLEKWNLRLGYNYLSYDQTVDDTDLRYDGTIKISSFSALLDWQIAGPFRLTFGAVGSGPKIEVVGTPTAGGTYEIGNTTYTAAQIGRVNGEIKIGNSVAPYVGIGFGNVVGKRGRVSFLFDLGAIYGGTPDVSLTATCNPSLPPATCTALQTQLNNDVAVEIADLEQDVQAIKWYPIISLGVGIRF